MVTEVREVASNVRSIWFKITGLAVESDHVRTSVSLKIFKHMTDV